MHYSGIIKFSIVDGIGCRTVLFVSGCSHQCKNCQNPKTWDKDYGKEFTGETLDKIVNELKRPEIDGLTFSGGDPLFKDNREPVFRIAKIIKNILPNKTIWLYTGYKWEDIKDLELLKYIDVVVDGKYQEDLRDITLAFRGSLNQRIIDVQKSLGKENPFILSFD